MPGSEGYTDPCLLRDLDTYPAHEPGDQQGRRPRPGPTHPTPSGHPKPQVRESRAQPPKLGRVDVLIHFSLTSSNVMRNWCRPVAQPQWRRQDFSLGGGVSRRRGGEAPKAPRGVGYEEGVSPPRRGMGLGRGLCPLPRKFLII